MQKSVAVILGIFFVVGLGLLGLLYKSSQSDAAPYYGRISVSGTAQATLKAESVFWSLDFVKTGKSLNEAYALIGADAQILREFLEAYGLGESDFSFEAAQVFDKSFGNGYIDVGQYAEENANTKNNKFIAKQTVSIYTNKIDAVQSIFGNVAELGKKNILFVVVNTNDYGKLRYFFPKTATAELNDAALADAKEQASKLALSAGKTLGDATSIYTQYEYAYNGEYLPNNLASKQQAVHVTIEYELKK